MFFTFFHDIGYRFGGIWVFLEHLSSLWRAGVILVRAFGLPGLFVGSRCYFLWCLWLVCAVSGLGNCSRTIFLLIFYCFVTLERGRGRATGEAEDHTDCKNRGRGLFCWFLSYLGIAWGLVGQCFCKVCLLNAFPVPMLRQVLRK